uniref:Glutamate receptor 2 n=1 Tax=Hirudo verbana TaxID=311461 RepID=A0A1W6AZ91_9ANNE|nr:glutamate receptor 2 [Hirudo verbana]
MRLSLFLLSALSPVAPNTFNLPIGVLMDYSREESIKTALRFGMATFNNKREKRFTLTDETLLLPMDNSFKVGSAICSLLQKGILAYFGVHTTNTLNTVKSYSATFNLPYITSAMAVNMTNQDKGYDLYIRPYYVRAILDLIRHYSWKEVYYFYSSNEGLERLQQLFDVATEDSYLMRTHVFRVQGADDVHKTLQRLDSTKSDDKRILLDLPTLECQKVLNMENNSPKGIKHFYMLVGLGMNEISVPIFKTGGLNVTGLSLIDYNNKVIKKVIVEWNKFLTFQRHVTSSEMEYDVHTAIPVDMALIIDSIFVMGVALGTIISNNLGHRGTTRNVEFYKNFAESLNCDAEPIQVWRHGSDVMKSLREINVSGLLTGNIKFDKFGLRRNYRLDVMEVSLGRALAKIGTWDSELGLLIQLPTMVRQKGNNTIANKTRIITSINSAPFLMNKLGDGWIGNDRYEGYCADLTKNVAEIIGFDYVIKPVNDSKYGSNDSGTWDGMVGELLRGEADMAIAPLTITADRESVIDFSKPFMSLGISIMIKRPSKEPPSVFSFMNPLSYEVWMCVIFAYIGVSVVLFLVSRFSPFEWHVEENQEGMAVTNNFTIFNSLWFSLGAFMQQGVDIEPRSMSGRIVGSVWWFFTLILISSYTANLAAFLTSERMQSPIESAEDLAKQTEIKYGTVEGGSTQGFFRKSTIPTYERMWAFMSSSDPQVFVKSTDEGVNMVREKNGKYAFLTESTQNEYTNQRKPCDTMKVGGNLDAKGYGIGTPMGSDLRDRVTLAVLELIEKGELANLEKKWWYEKGECSQEGTPKKQEATSSLKLSNVAGIFYILISGLVLSLIIAAIEFLHKTRLEAKRRKTSFTRAARTGARLSLTGQPHETLSSDDTPETQPPEVPPNMSMSTYSYAPGGQLVGIDGYGDTNMQTQV